MICEGQLNVVNWAFESLDPIDIFFIKLVKVEIVFDEILNLSHQEIPFILGHTWKSLNQIED